MLKELVTDQLWVAEMEAERLGFEFGARMTVIRLSGGGLFIHSPIELKPELKRQLDALGTVQFVVSPYRMHYMHLAEFVPVYPDAQFYAPPGLSTDLEGVTFHGVLGDAPEAEWADDLDQVAFRGNILDNEVVFFHQPSRTLILTDLCFNIPRDRSLLTRLIAGFLGVRQRFAPTRTFRLLTNDKQASRKSIQRILAWDFDRVILSHGQIVETRGKPAFRRAFAWLLK